MPQIPNEITSARNQLWQHGILEWKLRPVQKTMRAIFIAASKLITVFNCSRRLGKTFTVCLLVLEHCLTVPGAQVRFACATRTNLKKIVLPIFRRILLDCPDRMRPLWKASENMYVFPNGPDAKKPYEGGAEIHLEGCDNGHAENLRGTAATMCVVTEAGSIKDLKYLVDDILMPQLLTSIEAGIDAKLVMDSTPPRTPAHAFRHYCLKAEESGCYAEFDIEKSGYSKATIEKFIAEAGGRNSTTCQREYFCKFVVDLDSAIVPEWQPTYVGKGDTDSQLYGFWHKYEGMDTGFRDFTAILFAHYNWREARLYIEDELTIHGPTMTTKLIADSVRPVERRLWGNPDPNTLPPAVYRRIADNNDPIVLQDLSVTHNLNFAPTDKESLHAMVNKVREWVGAGRLRVSPKCKMLLGCLKYGVWDDKRKMFERVDDYRHFDHLAALVYLIRNIDEITNPIPPGFGVDRANTLFRQGSGLSKVGQALKDAFTARLGRKKL
jgi:hypothetical protein